MRLVALAVRLRSEDTKTPPAEPASVSVTPSESGRPAPSGKRSVLPADQPLAVSRTHWVPFHTSRSSRLPPLLTAQSTPGVLVPVPS